MDLFFTPTPPVPRAAISPPILALRCAFIGQNSNAKSASGTIEATTATEADAYFATRARLSQVGAWASRQSQPMHNRFELEQAVALNTLRFGLSKVPRPSYWNGYRVVPEKIEFWQERPFRHHDRRVFVRDGDSWLATWLFP